MRLWGLCVSAALSVSLVWSKLNFLRDCGNCFLSIDGQILDQIILLNSTEPLHGRLGIKHGMSIPISKIILDGEGQENSSWSASHHALLQRTSVWERSRVFCSSPLTKESSVLTVHLLEDQKMEIVTLYYLSSISDTLSVIHGFDTVLSHVSVWDCVIEVLYQKSAEKFASAPIRLQYTCTTGKTLSEVIWSDFVVGHMHLGKCFLYCPLDCVWAMRRIRSFILSRESKAIKSEDFKGGMATFVLVYFRGRH